MVGDSVLGRFQDKKLRDDEQAFREVRQLFKQCIFQRNSLIQVHRSSKPCVGAKRFDEYQAASWWLN
jgi:hypothetical protein